MKSKTNYANHRELSKLSLRRHSSIIIATSAATIATASIATRTIVQISKDPSNYCFISRFITLSVPVCVRSKNFFHCCL